MDRRDFLKTTAITGASAALTSCGSPEHQLIRFVPEEDLVPGVAVWKPSVCPLCRAGCGVQVRVMDGEAEVSRRGQRGTIAMGLAKKLEGNPAHPISHGKLCVRGQAAIQITYHPDRLTQPLKRTGARGTHRYQEVTWDEALKELIGRLDALAAAGEQRTLAFLTSAPPGQRRALIAQFLDRFGAPPPVAHDLFGDDVLRRANGLSFGRAQLPTFDLAEARYVIAFGADFLGTWNSPVAQSVAYGRMRQGRSGLRGRFVQVEPRMSQTGASADEWVPVKPGTEGVLALGLAHVILAAKLRSPDVAGRAGTLIEGWEAGLADYDLKQVAQRTGVAASRIERLARELVDHEPAIAMIGGAPLAQTNGMFQALAVNALHALVGRVGDRGGILFTPLASPERPPGPAISTLATLLSPERTPIKLLLLDGGNPVFAAPVAWQVKEKLQNVPFIASFGSFLDETSALADLILPDHSFLESWVEAAPESGASVAVRSLGPPAMKPLHQTRPMPDVLLEIAPRLQRPLDPPLPWKTFEQMLAAAYGDEWTTAREQGGMWGGERGVGSREWGVGSGGRDATSAAATPVGLVEPQFDGDAAEFPFHFLPYPSQAFLDGSLAHLPWLQELPDPVSTAMWSSWVEINPRTAERLQIAQGDLVEIASRHGTLQVPALISPGIAPDLLAMPVGQGHESFTRYASGRGANPVAILAPIAEPETGALAWAATRVRVTKVGGADGRLVLFAGEMRERPHEHER